MQPRAVPWGVRDAIIFTLAWIGLQILAYLLLAQTGWLGLDTSDLAQAFVAVSLNAAMATVLLWLYLRRYQARWRDLGWRGFNWLEAAGFIVVAIIGFQLVVAGLYQLVEYLWPSFNAEQKQLSEFLQPAGTAARYLSFVALVVLPPLVEETIFRGFLFPAFSKKWGVVAGAIISSSLFGLAHFQPNVIIYTWVLGLLLCMMYLRFKSIWPGIIFHGLNNYLAFMVLLNK